MSHKDIKTGLKALSHRAAVRRIACPAIKSSTDAKVENQNFSELKTYIYKKITEER